MVELSATKASRWLIFTTFIKHIERLRGRPVLPVKVARLETKTIVNQQLHELLKFTICRQNPVTAVRLSNNSWYHKIYPRTNVPFAEVIKIPCLQSIHGGIKHAESMLGVFLFLKDKKILDHTILRDLYGNSDSTPTVFDK